MKGIPRWQRLLSLMQHGGWVSMRDMAHVAGYRYGARLDDLKKMGWTHEHRARGTEGEIEYRLIPPMAPPGQMALNISQEVQT